MAERWKRGLGTAVTFTQQTKRVDTEPFPDCSKRRKRRGPLSPLADGSGIRQPFEGEPEEDDYDLHGGLRSRPDRLVNCCDVQEEESC